MAETDDAASGENFVTSHAGNGADTEPAVGIINQYVKDLSVENPNAPASFGWGAPNIEVQVNISANSIDEELNTVELKLSVTAQAEQGVAFAVELVYGGLIGMRNVPEEAKHPFLFAEAPRLLFPFARRVLADAVRDAGFPPLMLDPLDFGSLYVQQREQADALASQPPQGQA